MSLAGGAVLLALMLFTVIDVALRSAFNRPIYGAQEIGELGLVLVAVLGMAYCGRTNTHIVIDLAESFLPRRVLRIVDIMSRVVAAGVMAVISWRSAAEGLDAMASAKGTNVLRIPEAPFQWAIAFSLGLYALVLLVQAAELWRRESAKENAK